ncbi:MAG: heavy-metal-associated domain-containing protein [Gammaproteobacteria bacterium]|nr:heavy-metal-associated domain-containing protein [Gammaproteobacteria bacterium]
MIVKITGMSCNHCVNSVEKALRAVPGVQQIKEIRLDNGTAVIEGSPDTQAVITAIREAGYSAVVA